MKSCFKKLVGIYGLRCLKTDMWYIGQSWDIYDRWNKGYELMQCKNQQKIYCALKKYGYDGFEKRIIELCDENIPQEMLDLKEDLWIKHHNSIEHGYNIRPGGYNNHGWHHSDETKKKMMDRASSFINIKKAYMSNIGRVYSPEHCLNISTKKKESARVTNNEVRTKIRSGVQKAVKEGRYRKNKIPKDECEIVMGLYLSGEMNKRQIASRYGVNPGSIGKYLKKCGI